MPSNNLAAIASELAKLGVQRLLAASLLALIGYSLTTRLYNTYFGPLSKFPGPKIRGFTSLPKIITLIRGREQWDYVALHAKYGKIVRIAPNELSFSGNSAVWKDVLGFKKAGKGGFPKDPRFYAGEMWKPRVNVFLANADDRVHSKLRRVISHAFADKSLHDIEPRLLHWAKAFKDRLEAKARNGERINMVTMYNCATFDIMGDLAFNDDLGMLQHGEENKWVQDVFTGIKQSTFIRAVKNMGNTGWWFVDDVIMNLPQAQQGMRETLKFSNSRLAKRMTVEPERPDLWTQIMSKGVGDQSLDEAEHQGLAFFFMIAGTETTASALSGILYFLLNHPEYEAKLRDEIRANFTSFDELSFNKLAHLDYTNAVIQEGLRLYPPVPIAFPRRSPSQGGEVDGAYIPGNVVCGVHHLSTYLDPDNFRDPTSFRPERWLGDPKYKDDNLDAVEPFHVGPRGCIGKNLAWHEMRLLLVTTFLLFNLKLKAGSKNWLKDNEVYTVWQKPPLLCTVEPIKSN